MENLDIAIRRYQQLVPEPSSHLWHPGILRKLRVWLTDDVGPIAESLSRRPAFRERATWSLRVFKPGADTPERRAVDAMAGSLVRCAQIQLRLLGKKRLQKELARQNSPAVAAIEGGIEITGDESRATVLRHEPFDHLALEISQLESLAGGGPPKIADVKDYF
jgi:hypothetical protein